MNALHLYTTERCLNLTTSVPRQPYLALTARFKCLHIFTSAFLYVKVTNIIN